MKFQVGCAPGPGRPKGSASGRTRALQALDALLEDEQEQTALRDALRTYLHKDPIQFFKTIVMPLLPKEAQVEIDHGVVQWQSLLDIQPVQPGDKALLDASSAKQ